MRTEEERKKVKFLLVLPALVVPFLTMAFVALGGGSASQQVKAAEKQELITELPDAKPAGLPMDKLGYYNEAAEDSVKKASDRRADPYYQSMASQGNPNPYGMDGGQPLGGGYPYQDPNEAKVYERINRLNASLQAGGQGVRHPNPAPAGNYAAAATGGDVQRLESMMQMMGNGDQKDPEMAQISGMLEKILDIQHPDRVQEKLKQKSAQRRGQVFAVTTTASANPVTLLANKDSGISGAGGEGFYALGAAAQPQVSQNTIRAVVHGTQTLIAGAIVKLRLMNDVYINGDCIPKDCFVFGTANLSGERLSIEIENIRYKNSLYPVQLSVYDLDGMDGIHIPGAIARDAAKQSGANVIEGLSMSTMDPSIGAQAASAGIELSKNLFGKKVKMVKVIVKAGYEVLLRDANQ